MASAITPTASSGTSTDAAVRPASASRRARALDAPVAPEAPHEHRDELGRHQRGRRPVHVGGHPEHREDQEAGEHAPERRDDDDFHDERWCLRRASACRARASRGRRFDAQTVPTASSHAEHVCRSVKRMKSARVIFALAVLLSLAVPAAASAAIDFPLRGWWSFNEGRGQTVYDWSGKGNNGFLGSTPQADSNDPSWTRGIFGTSALSFGGDDFVSVDDSASLEPQAAHGRRLDQGVAVAGDLPLPDRQGQPGLRRRLVRADDRLQRRAPVLRLERQRASSTPASTTPRSTTASGITWPARSTARSRSCSSTAS